MTIFMTYISFSLISVVLAGNKPANLDAGRTPTVTCGLQDPGAQPMSGSLEQKQGAKLLERIVGGTPAGPDRYPWTVSLGQMKKYQGREGTVHRKYSHKCGASLITKDWLLTAAHCFVNLFDKSLETTANKWTVKLGAQNMHDFNSKTVETHSTAKIIIHEGFNHNMYPNDIALVKLPQPVAKFSNRINPVCLHDFDTARPLPGTSCNVTGWGQTAEGGYPSESLQVVEIDILNVTDCGDLDPGMLCAGKIEGGKDSCGGDSGGPLVCPGSGEGATTRWFLAGIVSFGEGCARPKLPGVYTDVSDYLTWIIDNINSN